MKPAAIPHETRRTPLAGVLVGGLIALIAVTAGYEILAAAQVIAYPADAASGDSLPFQTPLLELTYIAMALGSIVFLAAAFWGRLREPLAGTRMLWLIPLVAAALVLGKNYSFDSYDLPSLVRYADDGSGELLYWWVPIGLAGAALVGLLTPRAPSVVMLLVSAVLFFGAATALLAGAFH